MAINSNVLYIVIPCYNEEAVVSETIKRLKSLVVEWINHDLISKGSKLLFVNDGSSDNTWGIIEKTHEEDPFIGGVKLACNVGHQNALIAGLSIAVKLADIIVTIDADLQDDPTIIKEMIMDYKNGFDIVYGVRKERKSDTLFKRSTALLFYKLMKFLGVKSVYNHADFRLMSQRAVKQLLHYRERNLYLRGIVPLIGYETSIVYYNRAKRFAGESKYPLAKMFNFAVDGITSFSTKPVRMVFMIGVAFVLISFSILLYVLYSLLITKNNVAGWASLILSIWFIGGILLIGIGIIGEYIGKIYIEVKNRPRFNIEKVI